MWSDLVLKSLLIPYVVRIRMVHVASFQTQMKFNTRRLSFMVTYTRCGINQSGGRFGICGERAGGVVTREKTVVRSVGFVLP